MKLIKKTDSSPIYSDKKEWIALTLLGLPFLAVGSYFLYYCLYAIFEYIQYAQNLSNWLRLLPGLLIMSLLSVSFLSASFYFCATDCISVDRESETVNKYKKLLFVRTIGESKITSEIQNISFRQKTTTTNHSRRAGSARTYFIVELIPHNRNLPPFELIRILSPQRAKNFARELGKLLEIPLT